MSELRFERIPTGRTHQIAGVFEPILDANGDPETEYAVLAIVDGHKVPLETYTVGYVEHMVSRPDTAVDEAASSSASPSSEPATATTGTGTTGQSQDELAEAIATKLAAKLAGEPAAPAEGEGTAGEGAAAEAAPAEPAAG